MYLCVYVHDKICIWKILTSSFINPNLITSNQSFILQNNKWKTNKNSRDASICSKLSFILRKRIMGWVFSN